MRKITIHVDGICEPNSGGVGAATATQSSGNTKRPTAQAQPLHEPPDRLEATRVRVYIM